jgi:uncharacterized protein YegJ (DUF2314 family)
MSAYESGDFVKVEFTGQTGESEWMWIKVDKVDDAQGMVYGVLDNDPIVNPDLWRGMELAVSYDKIRDHMKPSSFKQ